MIAYLKATRRNFSYRYFSRVAGFSSPNFLKLVAEGRRSLSPASLPKFAKGLGLDEREREGFELLFLMSRASDPAERARYAARLRRMRDEGTVTRRIETAQFDVYTTWYILPVWELMWHPEFRDDPEWIARRLRFRVSVEQVEDALRTLEDAGLAEHDAQGRLRPVRRTLTTGPEVRSLAVRNYHRNMLRVAMRSLDSVPLARRDVSSLLLSLSAEQFAEIRALLERFRAELLAIVDREEGPAEGSDVYHLGIQLVPLTRPVRRETDDEDDANDENA